ncbi:hypothetical protein O3G_MSEX002121 [Manduca sexta]|uniref:rRNA biogenesis protein RRP5 n=1 Tax=Manduca sexta TaxID=7130 RepID=A0A921YMV6_MANSE|nr:hypothetical protein O3G_MSEX002121 [Manduca sexta]
MADVEEYFPRGGKKPSNKSFKQGGNFLGVSKGGEKKKRKPKKKTEGDDGYLSDDNANEHHKDTKSIIVGLSSKTVKEGTLTLARVRSTLETKLIVMMPGRLMGTVMACHISEPYNKVLEAYVNDEVAKVKELPNMFRPGQYIAVKVLEVDGQKFMLTAMPQHVNAGKKQADLHKSTVLQAAVSSIEDHGYVMDIGIPNTRAFLPKTEVDPELDLDVGMLAWCAIKSVSPSSDSSVVTLSATPAALQHGVIRHKPDTPLLPGSALQFTVETPMDNGIEGQVFEDTKAYILRQHTDKVKGKKPALGQKITARVLYVMPTRKTPFLTMKDIFSCTYPDLAEEQKFKDGDIVEDAQVLNIIGRGVWFKLGQDSIGSMGVKRIPVDEDLTDEQVIAKSYPIGSTHRVRIICYNLCDYVYAVSVSESILSQKYFNLAQLSVGQVVDATVKYIQETHVVLDLGRFTGMVPHSHVTEAGLVRDPKKGTSKLAKHKYKVGQEVRARVLSVDPVRQTLFLTMKPSLLAPDLEVLSSWDQAEIGKAYTGVIKYIRDFIIVAFFDNLTCYVPRHYVTKDPIENLMDAFHVGQIVNCTILSVDAESKKILGSLTTVPFWPEKKREKRKQTDKNSEVPEKRQRLSDEEDSSDAKSDVETDGADEVVDNKKKKLKKKNKEVTDMPEKTEPSKKKNKKDKKQAETSDNTQLKTDKKKDKKTKLQLDKTAEDTQEKRKRLNTDKSSESDPIETDISDNEEFKSKKGKKKQKVSEISQESDTKTKTDNKKKSKDNQVTETVSEEELKTKKGKKKKDTEFHVMAIPPQPEEPETKQSKKKKDKDKSLVETTEEVETKQKPEKKKKGADKNAVEKAANVTSKGKVETLKPVLEVPSAKDFWTGTLESAAKKTQEEDSSSSDDEETEQPKKKRKKLSVKEKLEKVRAEEERIRELERRAIESESQPRSSDQFERALLANPDCSQLWIAYMAFHLQATEIEKARAVAKKALNTISFREEQEKLNVWLALINLENRFGTKESQQKTLEDAIQMNEPYKIHSKLLDIYVETSKHQELSSLVDLMMRKYKREPNAFVLCGRACYKLGLVDKARHVMQKAVAVLEKKEHVSVLVQFALLERSHGALERAEALFEQVLAVYPQRVDVASAYLDMLVSGADVERIRFVVYLFFIFI